MSLRTETLRWCQGKSAGEGWRARTGPHPSSHALPSLTSPHLSHRYFLPRSWCSDCYETALILNGDDDWAEGMLQAAGEDYIRSGVAWCNATDTMPLQCDHLVTSRARMSGGE